jgi:CubicO group peptidase (beta-lactamase class C family)
VIKRCVGVVSLALAAALAGTSKVACAQHGGRALPSQVIAKLDSLAGAQLAQDGVGGMTIAVVTDSGVLWTNSYGYADMGRHALASRETVYRIGSITKQFTAIMLRQLVFRGVVRLSDAADRYLPALDSVPGQGARAHRVTLGQLATMTAGLAQEPDDEGRYMQGPLDGWEQALTAALRHTKFDADPGVAWEYSNIGYASLGAALQQASGVPYMDYVRDRILIPLRMTHSGFAPDETMRAHLATGYAMANHAVDTLQPRRELAGRGYKVPNGGLFSTIDDLAAFLRFEMGQGPETVLPRAEVAAHFSALTFATNDLMSGYGVGFHAVRRGSMVALGHPGSVAGYLSAAYFDPVTHTGALVLRNVDDPHFDVLGVCLQELEIAASTRR